MPSRLPFAPRLHFALALLAALGLGGCASIQSAVDTVKARLPGPAETPAAAESERSDKTDDAARPAPRPPRKLAAPPAPAAPAPAPAAPPPPALAKPAVSPATPARVDGPAWLARCAEVQVAGGVARCDADSLLARPSATVQVFTRDPALAVKGTGGDIILRPGLPHRYRFFVLP